jgi:hypothetical protein
MYIVLWFSVPGVRGEGGPGGGKADNPELPFCELDTYWDGPLLKKDFKKQKKISFNVNPQQ